MKSTMIPPNLLSTTSSSWIAQERYYSPYVQLWLFYLFAAFKENEQEDDEMRMDDLDDFLEPYTEKTLEECGLDWEDPVQWPNVPAAKQAQAIRRLSLWMRWSQARATAHLIKMSRISVPVDS
ncbi:Protein of unknown function [Pyronema omphalodes CBS 100304]|uniref:Uncharacterized protein n=1 Tax=Pyronema omphalodes (strain CBS 100304) TaxID=1076935 RepID=U4LLI5_PYROM|nr:Protein of unknown function [Pyronema omphalodes CBS 100304]